MNSGFEWVSNVGDKVYSATFESPNSCYVTSVIVMADSIEEADRKILKWRQGDRKYDCGETNPRK